MSDGLRSTSSLDEKEASLVEAQTTPATPEKIVWYRSTWYASIILGLCNFAAPGIWGAMNSLGAGGQATPFLVNGLFDFPLLESGQDGAAELLIRRLQLPTRSRSA